MSCDVFSRILKIQYNRRLIIADNHRTGYSSPHAYGLAVLSGADATHDGRCSHAVAAWVTAAWRGAISRMERCRPRQLSSRCIAVGRIYGSYMTSSVMLSCRCCDVYGGQYTV